MLSQSSLKLPPDFWGKPWNSRFLKSGSAKIPISEAAAKTRLLFFKSWQRACKESLYADKHMEGLLPMGFNGGNPIKGLLPVIRRFGVSIISRLKRKQSTKHIKAGGTALMYILFYIYLNFPLKIKGRFVFSKKIRRL